jgi:hypothetical protein
LFVWQHACSCGNDSWMDRGDCAGQTRHQRSGERHRAELPCGRPERSSPNWLQENEGHPVDWSRLALLRLIFMEARGAASTLGSLCRVEAQRDDGPRADVSRATSVDASTRYAADLFSVSLRCWRKAKAIMVNTAW